MTARHALARNVDSKGRLTLGEAFANRTVLIEERTGGELILRLARVIPEREAWLYHNPKALAAVRRGLDEAKSGRFASKPPDLRAARKLAARIPDGDE